MPCSLRPLYSAMQPPSALFRLNRLNQKTLLMQAKGKKSWQLTGDEERRPHDAQCRVHNFQKRGRLGNLQGQVHCLLTARHSTAGVIVAGAAGSMDAVVHAASFARLMHTQPQRCTVSEMGDYGPRGMDAKLSGRLLTHEAASHKHALRHSACRTLYTSALLPPSMIATRTVSPRISPLCMCSRR
eukprot:162452-Chlamydomonas_euryale.AAC.4